MLQKRFFVELFRGFSLPLEIVWLWKLSFYTDSTVFEKNSDAVYNS